MANEFFKPQSPLELDGNYIYPLTYHDQVILPSGNRWDGIPTVVNGKSGNITLNATDVGAAPATHNHTQYFETSKIVYSTTEPAGSAGMIWFKPAE